MRFEVLGPLRVHSRSDIPLRRAAHRRLLSILLLDHDRVSTADELIDRQWPDDVPRTARSALHTYLSQLRSALGPETLLTLDDGYRIALRGHQLDRELFDALASAARTAVDRAAWTEVVESADRALELWRGVPYPELQGDDFAAPQIARLEEQRLQLVELRAEALLALGKAEAAIPDLERAVAEEPLRERLWEHLMTARARLGRVTEAVAAYRQLRGVLEEVGLEPNPRVRDLEERILREDPSLVPATTRHNLPAPLSSFIGRESTMRDLAGLLDQHRLVTITGVGGAGKTRLATEVARRRMAAHPDGIWLVDLVPVGDPTLVLSTVAGTLGIPTDAAAEDSIRSVLRQRRALIILDNCEHLVAEAARVAELVLSSGPGVTVLATSRDPLKLPGERIHRLAPLDVPVHTAVGATDVLDTESGRLFADRARLASAGFSLTDATARSVAEICRRLAGLPLAIELVAAQAGALAPGVIERRLADGIGPMSEPGLGRPARQRAMRATIAWSEDLLSAPERSVFARLSVFSGGFTADAVEAICGEPAVEGTAVLDALRRLVETSLVEPVVVEGVPVRYRLLEPIRDFARDRLAARGETEATSRRHRDHYRQLAADLLHAPSSEAFTRLRDEHGNLETALDWSIARGDAEAAGQLAVELATYWLNGGQARRAANLVQRTLHSVDLDGLPDLEALVRAYLADAHHEMGDDEAALASAERAVTLTASSPPSIARVRSLVGSARYRMFVVHEDPAPALPLADEALATARAMGDASAELRALLIRGHALAWNGEGRAGLAQKRMALARADEIGDPGLVLGVYASFFDVLGLDGATRRHGPRRLVAEMEDRFARSPWWYEYAPWAGMAYVFMQTGEWDRAQEALDRARAGHLEGYMAMWTFHVISSLRWMQGRFAEARNAWAALRETSPAPRWYHDYFPLQAEIAAATGDLADARRAADDYLAVRVHASEAAMKTAVLAPLVRAEVDAALRSTGLRRDEHLERARTSHAQAHELLDRFPPTWSGCLQFETPRTHVLMADAELSRATGADPSAWQSVADAADYAYTRLYAGWRRSEALLALGRADEARASATTVLEEATRIGAEGLAAGAAAVASGASR